MNATVMIRLSIMMFLQFFVWGAWYMILGKYMLSYGMYEQVKWAYLVGPIAAIVSPCFVGMLADRRFSSERLLGTLHLLGGTLMVCAPLAMRFGAQTFLLLLLGHMLCYMPTLGLANALVFRNIDSQEKQFPIVRVFGTVGWIAAAWLASRGLPVDFLEQQFWFAGGSAVALGVFCFFLPHTPPAVSGSGDATAATGHTSTRSLLKQRSFFVFLVCAFLVCVPLASYFSYEPMFAGKVLTASSGETTDVEPIDTDNPPTAMESGEETEPSTPKDARQPAAGVRAMSIGQVAEIIFMLLLPLLFVRLGVKWMLVCGILAWVARYGLFSFANDGNTLWMVWAGIFLHGLCYDLFFVTGFVYTDKNCSPQIRAQAQGLLVTVTQGLGLGIGALLMSMVVWFYTPGGVINNSTNAQSFRRQAREAGNAVEQHQFLLEADEYQDAADELLVNIDWKRIWRIPAIIALLVMVGFVLLFNDDTGTPNGVEAAEDEPLLE